MKICVDQVDTSAVSKADFVRRPKELYPVRLKQALAHACEEWLSSLRFKRLSIVSGLLLVAVALSGCDDAIAVADVPPPDVDVAPVLVKQIRYWDEFNGQISAIGSVEIRPRVSGYIERVAFKEGDEVRRGDLLFSIDQRPYRAAVDSATARLERARATAQLAQLRDQRARTLVETSAVSRDEA